MGLVLSCHWVDSGNRTQVVGLGGTHFYQMNHFSMWHFGLEESLTFFSAESSSVEGEIK